MIISLALQRPSSRLAAALSRRSPATPGGTGIQQVTERDWHAKTTWRTSGLAMSENKWAVVQSSSIEGRPIQAIEDRIREPTGA